MEMNPTTAPAVTVYTEDEELADLEQLFSDIVEGVLAWPGSKDESSSYTCTIPGTDLTLEIEAGYDFETSWMAITATNGDGAKVWERSDGIDWESCDEVPAAFVAWFHEEQAR
jgi:hypothetical protein